MRNSKGYTLVEFLVIALILVTIASVVAGIIFSTIRSSSSSSAESDVTQNGNAALTIVSKIIQSSTGVTSVGGSAVGGCVTPASGDSITLRRVDGGITVLSCGGDSVSSNSASLTSSTVKVVAGTCTFSCTQKSVFESPYIDIQFTLKNADSNSSLQQTFETSTSMRNFTY